MTRVIDGYCRLLDALIAAALALMVVLVFGNVVLRYGFNSGITVSEELSRWLFLWMTFLGAVVAMKEHAHLGSDMLVSRLPRIGKRICLIAGQLLMQFGFTLPVFSLLTRALTDAGFAVLRFDKRSCGQFNNCSKAAYPLPSADLTIQTFVSDVRGALDYLEQRPEIDPNRIALIGHSEGASYVPTLLQERPATLAGVLLAAPFSAFDTILRNQLAFSRQILTEYGLAEPQIEAELKQVSELSAELDQLRVGAFQGNQIAGIGVGFWSSLLSLGDEAPRILNEVAQPVLLVGGDYDWNVPPSELQHWRTALAARDSNRTTIRSLVCMTHALNCISQADHRQIQEADISRELHPELATTLLSILE